MDTPLFGPAGSSASFEAEGHSSTMEAPAWLAARGLTAFEYQCGHGVRVKLETAAKFGAEAKAHGIAVSLHAPYYISLASEDPAKRDNSVRYILDSARLVNAMGGERIVVHPGGLGGLSRPGAAALAAETLRRAQGALDDEGLSGVHICPETMGKIQQLGISTRCCFSAGSTNGSCPASISGTSMPAPWAAWRPRRILPRCSTPSGTGSERNAAGGFTLIFPALNSAKAEKSGT